MSRSTLLLDYLASRVRLLLFVLAVVSTYGAVGLYVLPHFAQTRWLPELARQTRLHVAAERFIYEPFNLMVRLDGLSLQDPGGQPLLAADEARITLDALDSLRHWRLAVTIGLRAPVIHLQRDRQGQFSLGGRLPERSGDTATGLPFILSGLTIENGRLEFQDRMRGTPVTTRFQNLSAIVGNLGADPAFATPFRLSAEGPKDERLSLEGTGSLKPLKIDAELDVEHLRLSFWVDTLAPDFDWNIRSGLLTTRSTFQYPSVTPLRMAMRSDRLVFAGLDAAHRRDANQGLRAGKIELENTRLGQEAPELRIGTALLSNAASPWGSAAQIKAGGITLNLASHDLRLDSLSAQTLETPQGKAKAIDSGPLAFEAGEERVTLALLSAPEISAEWGSATALAVEGLDYGLKDRRLALGTVSATTVNSRWGDITAASVTGLDYAPGDPQVHMASFSAREVKSPYGSFTAPTLNNAVYRLADRQLALDELTLEHAVTPWGKTAGLAVNTLVADIGAPALHIGTLAATRLDLPGGNLATIAGEDIAWSGRERRLVLGHGTGTGLTTAIASAGRVEANALTLDLARQSFAVKTARLADVIALGHIENEADEPPPGILATTVTDTPPDASRDKTRRGYLGLLDFEDARGDLDQRWLAARRITSGNTRFDFTRLKNHGLEIKGLPAFSALPTATVSHASKWRLVVEEFELKEYSITFRDEITDPPVRLRFNGLALRAFDIDTGGHDNLEFRLVTQVGESGKVEAEGRARLNPFRASFRFGIDKLRLRAVEPYWKPLTNIDVQRGRLNMWGDAIIRKDPILHLGYAGAADILEFDAVDRPRQQPFLKWNSLKFDGLVISDQPRRFVTRILTAEQAHLRVALDEHRQLNLLEALEPPSQAAIPAELEVLQVEKTPRNQLPAASIGLLRIKDGTVDLSDRSMTPGFAGEIRHLEGAVSGLSSRADAIATLILDGRINRNSPVKVFGELEPMDYRGHTDVTLQFKGLNLTTFSAYSGKFGGYRIEKGKLDMDLRYTMKDTQMEVENRAVLDQLTLGDRVDESSSWLVDLAIAILKNNDGRIDLNLPIYGSLADPQFSLWSLYGDAFASLFAKLYYSPASLVNGMLGAETRHYTLRFAAGHSELDIAASDALKPIAVNLMEQPDATLDIRGSTDPGRIGWRSRRRRCSKGSRPAAASSCGPRASGSGARPSPI